MSSRVLVIAVAALAALSLVVAGPASAESPNVNTPATITGNAVVGEQLTAHNGTWLYLDGSSCGSECTMTYQWQRCSASSSCGDVSGATGRFYTVQAADAGSTLRVLETMTSEDCGNINYATGTQECRDVSKSAPSGQTAIVPGSAPASPGAPSVPAAPKPQAPLAPAATAAPRVSGLAMVDQTLTATRGTWSGSQPLTVSLQWQRCDAQAANCQDLGLSGDTYTVIPFDIGKTLRVRITASNASGAREAVSDATAVVTELKPTEQNPTLPAASVAAPHKLVIADLQVRPLRFTSRGPLRVTLRVKDSRGFLIQGAVVSAAVLPGTALKAAATVETAADGLATLAFGPGAKLKQRVKTITVVVIARRPGDKLVSPRAATVRVKVPVRRAVKARARR